MGWFNYSATPSHYKLDKNVTTVATYKSLIKQLLAFQGSVAWLLYLDGNML